MTPTSLQTSTSSISQTARAHPSASLEVFLQAHAFTLTLLLLYVNANVLLFLYGALSQLAYTPTPVLRHLVAVARGAGVTLNLNSALVLLVACRSAITAVRRWRVALVVPFDKIFPGFHIVVGWALVAGVVVHTAFHLAWIVRFDGWGGGMWGINMCAATGFGLILLVVGIAGFGVKRVRDKAFKWGRRVHVACAIAFYPLLAVHGVWYAEPYSYKWIVGPALCYIADRAWRSWVSTSPFFEAGSADFKMCEGGITGVSLPRVLDFEAGQYAELQVPDLDGSWHPFTIASAVHDERIRFYVREAGMWTRGLRALAKGDGTVRIRYRGPYGAPAQHVSSYKNVVLISGGVGSTPFCSVAQSCNFRKMSQNGSEGWRNIEKEEREVREGESFHSGIAEEVLGGLTVADLGSRGANLRKRWRGDDFEESSLDFDRYDADDDDDDDASVVSDMSNFTFSTESPSTAAPFQAADRGNESLEELWSSTLTKRFANEFPRKSSRAEGVGAGALELLRCVRAAFVLLWLLLTRVILLAYAAVYGRLTLVPYIFSSSIMTGIDLWASVCIVIILVATVGLELWTKGAVRYFKTVARCLDFFFLVPAALGSTFVALSAVAGYELYPSVAGFHLSLFLPCLGLLLSARLYRVVGDRVLLADSSQCASFAQTEKIDFIWTTPDTRSDIWLQDELLGISGQFVGLHRYVTREQPGEGGEASELSRRFNTVFGQRPDFDLLFRKIAHTAKSGSKIGVMFCGPPAMGDTIKVSLLKAQTLSILRGNFLNKQSAESMSDLKRLRKTNIATSSGRHLSGSCSLNCSCED